MTTTTDTTTGYDPRAEDTYLHLSNRSVATRKYQTANETMSVERYDGDSFGYVALNDNTGNEHIVQVEADVLDRLLQHPELMSAVSPAVARTWIRALQATYNTHLHLDEPKCVTMCNQLMNQLLDAVSKN